MQANPADIERYLHILSETPARIIACTVTQSEAVLHRQPGRNEMSVAEILAQLRACEELCAYNIYAMLSLESPCLPLIDERRWAKVTGYAAQKVTPALDVFVTRRADLLNVLRPLPFESWSRSAEIGGSNQTIFTQVRRMALSELDRVQQIEVILGCKTL